MVRATVSKPARYPIQLSQQEEKVKEENEGKKEEEKRRRSDLRFSMCPYESACVCACMFGTLHQHSVYMHAILYLIAAASNSLSQTPLVEPTLTYRHIKEIAAKCIRSQSIFLGRKV